MNSSCSLDGCAVAETGRCALERDPETCENRSNAAPTIERIVPRPAPAAPPAPNTDLGAAVLPALTPKASFSSSRTLGQDVLSGLMKGRYVNVIGILGDPDSGKTACLVSLYLMVANSSLSRWNFSESKSLMGFEDIARAAREWNRGTPPDQMTLRTELSDDRQPGFLHLRLCERESGRKVDFALPDLPGEWTTSLIGQGRTDRFSFLSAVDVLWLVVDGRKLSNRESKQGALNRMGQLAARLKNMLPSTPRVIVVATHHDTSPISSTDKEKLVKEFEKRSIGIEIVSVSPFSVSARVRAGYGLEELLEASLELPADTDSASDSSTRPRVSREFLKYRRQA